MIQNVPLEPVTDVLLELAYDTGSICTYAFACSLLAEGQTAEHHFLAALLLSHPLCHQPDAYRAAFFHTKRAVELAPEDVGYLEYLLFFYGVPDDLELISKEDARQIAREVLKRNPASVAAEEFLAK